MDFRNVFRFDYKNGWHFDICSWQATHRSVVRPRAVTCIRIPVRKSELKTRWTFNDTKRNESRVQFVQLVSTKGKVEEVAISWAAMLEIHQGIRNQIRMIASSTRRKTCWFCSCNAFSCPLWPSQLSILPAMPVVIRSWHFSSYPTHYARTRRSVYVCVVEQTLGSLNSIIS